MYLPGSPPQRIDHSDLRDNDLNDGLKPKVTYVAPKNTAEIIKILTANVRFSTTASLKKVFLGDSNNDPQPEIYRNRKYSHLEL